MIKLRHISLHWSKNLFCFYLQWYVHQAFDRLQNYVIYYNYYLLRSIQYVSDSTSFTLCYLILKASLWGRNDNRVLQMRKLKLGDVHHSAQVLLVRRSRAGVLRLPLWQPVPLPTAVHASHFLPGGQAEKLTSRLSGHPKARGRGLSWQMMESINMSKVQSLRRWDGRLEFLWGAITWPISPHF